jgi:hypothetical protein
VLSLKKWVLKKGIPKDLPLIQNEKCSVRSDDRNRVQFTNLSTSINICRVRGYGHERHVEEA